MNVEPITHKLEQSTENKVSCWEKIDFIVSAVDSVHAREYIMRRAIELGISLFNAGTEGPYCSLEEYVVNYHDTYVKPHVEENHFQPSCTLGLFYRIEHVMQYAKYVFEQLFQNQIQTLQNIIDKMLDNIELDSNEKVSS